MNNNHIDKGKLQIEVLSDITAIPVQNAQVRITAPEGQIISDTMQTNISGQTEFIELPAPPIEYSISESDEKPYSNYNVLVSAPEFEQLFITGVEILPTQSSIQQLRIKPSTPSGFNVQNKQIVPHTLWGDYPPKIPEPEVKELPDASGFIVLPEPVIPEFIIVHLGLPDDASAKNTWVQFQDYIKNVASSEVYSTWTNATLRANILAILSFTLNRVFTEWYRNKGKDFTITNTTSFDQKYRENGTVFQEISTIVDEIFTTYITKEGIRQPLLTQFCDGRRTTCPGLSQWGSQALGEQGLDAISILKNYYGSEIYLETAKKVAGIPSSYGGVPLKKGSTGEAVRTIQTQLNAISANYPAIPKLRVDGIYGADTENAVKIFQGIFHLPQTGIVDFATWYQISGIFVAVSKLAELF